MFCLCDIMINDYVWHKGECYGNDCDDKAGLITTVMMAVMVWWYDMILTAMKWHMFGMSNTDTLHLMW